MRKSPSSAARSRLRPRGRVSSSGKGLSGRREAPPPRSAKPRDARVCRQTHPPDLEALAPQRVLSALQVRTLVQRARRRLPVLLPSLQSNVLQRARCRDPDRVADGPAGAARAGARNRQRAQSLFPHASRRRRQIRAGARRSERRRRRLPSHAILRSDRQHLNTGTRGVQREATRAGKTGAGNLPFAALLVAAGPARHHPSRGIQPAPRPHATGGANSARRSPVPPADLGGQSLARSVVGGHSQRPIRSSLPQRQRARCSNIPAGPPLGRYFMSIDRRSFVARVAALAASRAVRPTQTTKPSDPLGVRADFPIVAERAYLNSAYIAPMPRPVVAAGTEFLANKSTRPLEVGELLGTCEAVRRQFARLVNATADEIGLLFSTAEGENVIAQGLDLVAGDNVVVDELHYPTEIVLYRALEASRGIAMARSTQAISRRSSTGGRASSRWPGCRIRTAFVTTCVRSRTWRMPTAPCSTPMRFRQSGCSRSTYRRPG